MFNRQQLENLGIRIEETNGVSQSKFYMIYGDGRLAPTKKHDNLEVAKLEAIRLSKKHPSTKFYILASIKGYVVEMPEPTEIFITPSKSFKFDA